MNKWNYAQVLEKLKDVSYHAGSFPKRMVRDLQGKTDDELTAAQKQWLGFILFRHRVQVLGKAYKKAGYKYITENFITEPLPDPRTDPIKTKKQIKKESKIDEKIIINAVRVNSVQLHIAGTEFRNTDRSIQR